LEYYENETLDAFGLHVYGMVLLASGDKAPLPPHTPAPQTVLMRSILSFPYNWSAWLDLAECAIQAGADGEAAIEEGLQPVLSGHWMYHFFCAHLQAHGHANHGQALQIYRKWSEPGLFGGSPYLLTECALAHYHLRQFADAQHILQGLHVDMPYRLESMDIYSNILYVQEDAVALSQLAHVAVQVDQYRPETSCIVGNYYSLKQQRAKAIQAFQRALALDRTYVSAWTLMGHEYVEWKQTAHAMEAYRQAVHVAPKDYRAWYGLGQTYEFLSMYLYALYYYKQATTFRPHDARMWCSIGQVLVHLGRQKDAIRAYERALQLDDAEGVATLKLAHLYNELNLSDKAAACYARHLQLRYVASQGPGKATAISDLPPLEVLLPHIVVQEPEAEALLYLAQYHTREAGDYETASVLASRLLEYPGPEKEQAKALLREIRSRHNKSSGAAAPPPPRRVYQTRSRGPPTESFDFSP
jgi:anaphase-promoting complex subunit 8